MSTIPDALMRMPRTLLRDLRGQSGYDVEVQGWVRAIRDQKKIQFLILRDHTGLAQATVERTPQHAALNDLVATLPRESAVTVLGRVVENPIVKTGGVEILIQGVVVDTSTASFRDIVSSPMAAADFFTAIAPGTTIVKVKWNTFTSTSAPVNEADIESVP